MKMNLKRTAILMTTIFLLTACGGESQAEDNVEVTEKINIEEATEIVLSDDSITVAGEEISEENTKEVYKANDIIYYEAGHDFTYGEGTAEEAHTVEEANAHTVVHITEPGMYSVSGKLSRGQIAIDLGVDAKEDPNAVVTLVMNGADINCDVAPAVIFYNVYECGSTEEADATNTVDTTTAGANVYIMNGTENNITGSHVARIYESYVLNEEGTEVADSKKLHKYDAAFYSKMTMNVDGAQNTTGVLNINADNEGLDSDNDVVGSYTPENDFSIMILSTADMIEGSYTFWQDETQLSGAAGQFGGMMRPGNMEMPEGMTPPQGGFGGRGDEDFVSGELSKEFAFTSEGNYYSNVSAAEK